MHQIVYSGSCGSVFFFQEVSFNGMCCAVAEMEIKNKKAKKGISFIIKILDGQN
jgi:hypothetical protein